jgi:hypothetical protein
MRCLSSIIATFFSFVTVLPTVRALPQSIPYVLKRDSLNATHRELTLEKRFNNGRFSFYDAGLGACGKTNTGSDFVSRNSVAATPTSITYELISRGIVDRGVERCCEYCAVTSRGQS